MKTSEDPKVVYSDIINHPHHQSETRPHMSLYDRAAQFSAFDALAGYSDMISEEARLTDSKIELDENEKEILNQKLSLIADVIEDGQNPIITFTVFVPDQFKAGGKYEIITDTVKGVDVLSQKIVLEAFVEKMKYEPHQSGDILLISGVGKVYPFMRSHKILDNIQHIFADIPVLMLYPGKFDGQNLDLFGRFLDGHYYRAFNLL